jgi:hypothetical protein
MHPFHTKIIFTAALVGLICVGPVRAQVYTEVQASSTVIGDVEFDWGRDGIYCASCNFGESNARFNWTDRENNLWVGRLDPTTGAFTPEEGQNDLVDTTAFFWMDWGNGPEWAFSTQEGVVASQLVYTRYVAGQAPVAGNSGAAFATMTGAGQWAYGFLPGAFSTPSDGGYNNTVLPEASQCTTDGVALTIMKNLSTPQQMFTEPVSSAPGTAPTLTPFGPYANGIGERWVPCTHWMTFQGDARSTKHGAEVQQVFWYDVDTQAVQQLTSEPTTKQRAIMFKAPDFDDNYVLVALSADDAILVFESTEFAANGSPIFKLVNTLKSPDPNEQYMFDPKVFINCTPTCITYVLMGLAASPNSQQTITVPNGLGLATLSKQNGFFKILVNNQNTIQRLDPKYYITANGPYIYYDYINVLIVGSGTNTYLNEGVFYIDLQLGAPSGPCVGSSAEGGLMPGC